MGADPRLGCPQGDQAGQDRSCVGAWSQVGLQGRVGAGQGLLQRLQTQAREIPTYTVRVMNLTQAPGCSEGYMEHSQKQSFISE